MYFGAQQSTKQPLYWYLEPLGHHESLLVSSRLRPRGYATGTTMYYYYPNGPGTKIVEVSAPNYIQLWNLGPRTLLLGHLDPLGWYHYFEILPTLLA